MKMRQPVRIFIFVLFLAGIVTAQFSAQDILKVWDEDGDGGLNDEEFDEMFISIFLPAADPHDHGHEEEEGATHDYTIASALNETFPCLLPDALFEQLNTDNDTILSGPELDNIGTQFTVMLVNQCELSEAESGPVCTISVEGAWAGGIISSIVVSLLTIVAIVLIPVKKSSVNWNKVIILPLVAFAVGTLLGDAIFHLIPESVGLHGHEEGGEELEEPVDEHYYLLPTGITLISILAFFLLEKAITKITGVNHTHVLDHSEGEDHDHHSKKVKDEEVELPVVSEKELKGSESSRNLKSDEANEKHGKFGKFVQFWLGIPAQAYLILVADLLHNFVDGLALGSSWFVSLPAGLATTIAIITHEIPQELGDFAMLVATGLSKWKALFLNFLSALSCIIGAIIGLAIGDAVEGGVQYISAITAGGFLYIALADMLHELKHFKKWRDTFVQLFAMALGMTIMLLIALYGESISLCV